MEIKPCVARAEFVKSESELFTVSFCATWLFYVHQNCFQEQIFWRTGQKLNHWVQQAQQQTVEMEYFGEDTQTSAVQRRLDLLEVNPAASLKLSDSEKR